MQPSPYTTWDAPPHASSFMASSRFDNSSFPTTPEIDAVTPHSGFTQEETSEYSHRTRHHASQGNGYQARVGKAIRRAIGAEERKQSSHCKETALSTTTPPVTVASPVTVHPPMMVQSPMMAPPATIVHPPMIIDPRLMVDPLMIDPLMMVDPPTMVDPAAVHTHMFLHQVSATHPDCPFDAAFPAQHPQVPESWWQ